MDLAGIEPASFAGVGFHSLLSRCPPHRVLQALKTVMRYGGPDGIRTRMFAVAWSLLTPKAALETRPASDPFCEPFAASSTMRQPYIVSGNAIPFDTMRRLGEARISTANARDHLANIRHFWMRKPFPTSPKLGSGSGVRTRDLRLMKPAL